MLLLIENQKKKIITLFFNIKKSRITKGRRRKNIFTLMVALLGINVEEEMKQINGLYCFSLYKISKELRH